MKRFKKILIVLSAVVVLFVSVFAVSASAIEIYNYVQLDPQTTLMSVDVNGNVVNQGLLALPSTIIPPNNSTGAYQTYGDFSTVKYRWQSFVNNAFGVHSVSNYKTWIYQDYNYLDVRGLNAGAYDLTVQGYFGHYDGNFGVDRSQYSNSVDLLTIRFDIVSTDGGADYEFNTHTYRLDGNGPTFTLSSYLRYLGYLGVYDSQRVYLKNLYVECGSGNWDNYAGVDDYGFETIVKLYTNDGQYWEEYGSGESSSFDPSMQAILDNLSYHYSLAGYNNGYNVGFTDGETEGYNSGYIVGENDGYYSGFTDGEIEGYNSGYNVGFNEGETIGYEDGYNLAISQNQIVKDGMFGWIMSGLDGFMQFEIFEGFSIGWMLSIVVGVSCLIWLLKLLAGG